MSRKSLLAMALVFLMTLITVSAWAVPTVINFQGKLTDPDGVSVPDGSYTMRFVIYDDVGPGGTLLWQETQSVPVADGIYSVQLGYVTVFPAALFDNAALYLEVRVYNQATSSWETLEPRQQLTSTAFSMKAAKAEDAELLEGLPAGAFIGTGGGTMSGPLSVPSLQIDGKTALRAQGDSTYLGLYTGSSSGTRNTLMGYQAGSSLTTANGNTFVGKDSGYSTTYGGYNVFMGLDSGRSNTGGWDNTFVGSFAGKSNIDGDYNTFIGRDAGTSNTTGSENTYIGAGAGYYSPGGGENVFVGRFAGQGNSTGSRNTFLGSYAGEGNGDGMENTFIGYHAGDQGGGDYNTFVGTYAGFSNTDAYNNTYIGHSAGRNNNLGYDNTFMGTGSGYSNTSGSFNTFIGTAAGEKNTEGEHNTFIGNRAGNSNVTIEGSGGDENTFVGSLAGFSNTDGHGNSFFGYGAGMNHAEGTLNTYVGNNAGSGGSSGTNNTFIGSYAGHDYIGFHNTFIGWEAGLRNEGSSNVFIGIGNGSLNQTGSGNVFIGNQAGYVNQTGSGNVFLGDWAGYYEKGSEKLYIDNSTTSSPLIWGDFSSDILTINGKAGIGTTSPATKFHVVGGSDAEVNLPLSGFLVIGPTNSANIVMDSNEIIARNNSSAADLYIQKDSGNLSIGTADAPTQKLDVLGNARFRVVGSGSATRDLYLTSDGTLVVSTSDGRLKTNIENIEDGLEIVKKLQGVRFNWKEDPEGERRIGLIAQDAEKVVPELTFTNPADGYMGVNYAELSAVLIEAVKEQQEIIDQLTARVDDLESNKKAEMESLKAQLTSLQRVVQTLIAGQSQSEDAALLVGMER